MSSLADNLLSRHRTEPSEEQRQSQPKKFMDLKSLPQLKRSSGSTGTTSASSVRSAPSVSTLSPIGAGGTTYPSENAPQIANTGVTSTTVTLVTPDQTQMREAAQQVMDDCRVSIAIAKSAAPRHATFMIKGNANNVESARAQLEEALQPRVQVTVEIPQGARSALIGARGANLRAIEQRHRVQLDLQRAPSSRWSLERTPVVISGGERGVEAARADVLSVVDEQRQVTSVRQFVSPQAPELALLVFADKRPILQGPLPRVLAEMARVDAELASIESSYESRTVSTDGIKVPADLLLEQRALVISSKGNDKEVVLYAPVESANAAETALRKYLATQTHSELDISRAHSGDVAHARVLARYLAAIRAIEKIGAEHGVQIKVARELVYSISGESESVAKARKVLVKQVNALSPATLGVVRGMHHALVRKRAEEALKTLSGPVRATIGPSDELYLVYEDPGDDFAPSDSAIRESVVAAQSQLSFLTDLANTLSRKVYPLASNAETAMVLNPLGTEAQELRSTLDVEIVANQDEEGGVVVSGTKSAVDAAIETIPRILQLSRNHAIKASHVEEFQIDSELVRQVIGRQGAQIQSFRNEFDVKMEVDKTGRCTIQGVESDTKECMKSVLEFQKRLRDESQEELEIPAEFHSKLIGPKGKYVNRLREKHQCTIRFPTDGGSVIFIRGPSRGVNAVKREFLELVEYEKQQSYSESFTVPAATAPRIVGKNGLVVNTIKMETGAQIDVGSAANADDQVEVKVIGEQKKVKAAIAKLRAAAEAANDFTERSVTVDQQLWRRLVAQRQQLVSEAGGDSENAGRTLIIPPQNSPKTASVRLVGGSEVVNKLEKLVLQFVEDAETKSKFKQQLEVPDNRLRRVAGAGGSVRRETETKFDVLVDVPNGSTSGDKRSAVTVTGATEEAVSKAIEHLRAISLPESTTVPVVAAGWTNQLRRNVQEKFGVRASLRGSGKLPAPPASGTASFSITPDATVEIEGQSSKSCTEAAEYIKERTPSSVAYIHISPEKLGQIIGPGGRTIRQTRQKTGCSIELPTGGPAVLIGTVEQVNAALAALN